MTTPAATPSKGSSSSAGSPRIGGGTDGDTWWTGGPNTKPLSRPMTINARRPDDFKSAEKIEYNCTKGIPEGRRLGTEDDKDATITLTTWINELREEIEATGMDTVFWVMKGMQETYLLSDWGAISRDMLNTWIDHLKKGVFKGGSRASVCPFDLDNLHRSAKEVKNSITIRMWEEIESELPYGVSGPEIFFAIMSKVQHSSASASRALMKKLEGMKLNKESGMNVETFATRITELVHRIEGCDARSIPQDLSTVVATCFLDTNVDEFKLTASSIFNKVDLDPSCMTWPQIIQELKTKYRSLDGLGRWPHKTKKNPADEIAALTGSLNKLTQKMEVCTRTKTTKQRIYPKSNAFGVVEKAIWLEIVLRIRVMEVVMVTMGHPRRAIGPRQLPRTMNHIPRRSMESNGSGARSVDDGARMLTNTLLQTTKPRLSLLQLKVAQLLPQREQEILVVYK